jgi:hypothetical protein
MTGLGPDRILLILSILSRNDFFVSFVTSWFDSICVCDQSKLPSTMSATPLPAGTMG